MPQCPIAGDATARIVCIAKANRIYFSNSKLPSTINTLLIAMVEATQSQNTVLNDVSAAREKV